MVPKYNPSIRAGGQPEGPLPKDRTTVDPKNDARGGRKAPTDAEPNALAKTGKKSIDVVLDLDDPDQARSLEVFRRAFGDDYAEVESLGHGKVVLKLHPGGARRLL